MMMFPPLTSRVMRTPAVTRFNFASSVRDKELEFYNSLDDWWSPDGPQKQLHKFNRVRVNFIRRNLLT